MVSCDNYVKPAAICYNFPPSVTTTSSENSVKTWNVLKTVITLHQKTFRNILKNKDYDNKKEFGKVDAHEHRYRRNFQFRFFIL